MIRMRKMGRVFLAAFLNCCFAVYGISAQQLTLTLDDAIQTALENNSSLKSQAVKLKQAERADKSAWNNFLPSISVKTSFPLIFLLIIPLEKENESFFFAMINPPR